MATEEEDLCAIELCALDKKTRLHAVTKRTSPTSEAVTYVRVPFIRSETEKDREKAARFQVLNEGHTFTWHTLGALPVEGGVHHAEVFHIAKPCVARAMRTRYRGKPNEGFVCIWCPATSVRNGWAWINNGVDPHASCTVANQGIVLDVHTGMQVWSGYENPHGKRVLAMLRQKHPDACKPLAFALAEHPFATFKTDTSKITAPLRESLREMGAL